MRATSRKLRGAQRKAGIVRGAVGGYNKRSLKVYNLLMLSDRDVFHANLAVPNSDNAPLDKHKYKAQMQGEE